MYQKLHENQLRVFESTRTFFIVVSLNESNKANGREKPTIYFLETGKTTEFYTTQYLERNSMVYE